MHAPVAGWPSAASFADETRLVVQLDHPGIARVLDVAGGVDGPCLILECLHGEDVHVVLDELRRTHRRMTYGIAVRIAADVAAALHHAHVRSGPDGRALEIVHRDVSPSNLLVTYDGAVKLLDFGIAKWTGASERTELGVVKGKTPYLAPEQCVQGLVDGRTDVFALGAVLYEMTTLRAPFGATLGDEAAIMDRIVAGRYEPPARIVEDYPPELAAIVARCLAPVRELRYRTAAELHAELVAVAAARGWAAGDEDLAAWLHDLFGDRSPPWLDDPPTQIVGIPAEVDDTGGHGGDQTVIARPSPRLLEAAGAGAGTGALIRAQTAEVAWPPAAEPSLPGAPPLDDERTVLDRPPAAPRTWRDVVAAVAVVAVVVLLIAALLALGR